MSKSVVKVPSLKRSAFDVFYRDVLCRATPSTVQFVRGCFMEMGTKGKKYRFKCLNKLNKSYSNYLKAVEKLPDSTVVLDCILDESFQEDILDLCMISPFESSRSFAKLLAITAFRCPKLETLEILCYPNFTWAPSAPIPGPIPVASFSTLSYLGLHFVDDEWFRVDSNKSVFGIIGKYCSNLQILDINGTGMTKKDALSLIVVGDLADILFPYYDGLSEKEFHSMACQIFSKLPPDSDEIDWSEDSVLPGLRVPYEFLNPLCFTLRELNFNEWKYQDPFTAGGVMAFALRHLPKLVTMEPKPGEAIPLIKLVYNSEKMLKTRQVDFGEACRKAALTIALKVDPLTPPPLLNYEDFLSLKELEKVPLDDGANTLRAIGRFCPQLEEVRFFGDSDICVDELQSILNGWPKVKVVKLLKVNSRCVAPILNVFGSSLVSLNLRSCPLPIDLALLASCNVLKDLNIYECSIISEGTDPTIRWTSETCLPSLESLITESCCLGVWAALLETKSTLNRLELECYHHIEIDGDDDGCFLDLEHSTDEEMGEDQDVDEFDNFKDHSLIKFFNSLEIIIEE